jgi:multiple sugar transport system substrate-binding protein
MSASISRREFLRLGVAIGGAAALAACGAPATKAPVAEEGPTAAPQGGEKVTITHWQSDWGKEWNDPMIKLSDTWIEDTGVNAEMEWTFLTDLTEKLPSAIAAGDPPDIATIDEGYGIPKMAKAGGLMNLKSYYEADGIKGEDFIRFTWETCLYHNEPYGIPGGAGALVLWYRKDLFEKAGIDPESVPDTPSWAQFMDWNQKLIQRDSAGKITNYGLIWPWWDQWFGVLGAGPYYNEDLTKLLLNSPETVEAVQKVRSTLPEGMTVDELNTLNSGIPTTWFGGLGSGIQAIVADGYWSFYALDNYWKDLDYGCVKLPTPNGTKDEWKLYTGWVWDPSIPKGAKHPDMAWQFLKYGYWEHGEKLAYTLNWTSSLKCFEEFIKITEEIAGADNRIIPYLHHFSEAQYAAKTFYPWTPIFQKLNDTMGQAIDQVMRDLKTAQEALDEVVATMQPELDAAVAEGF